MVRFDESLSILGKIKADHGETPKRYLDIASCSIVVADITLKQDCHMGVKEARRLYNSSLSIYRKLIDDCKTSWRHRDMIVPIEKFGDIALNHDGDIDKARILFAEAFSISQQLINDYGETPELKHAVSKYRDIMDSLN